MSDTDLKIIIIIIIGYSADTGATLPVMGFRLRIEKEKYGMRVVLKIFLYFLGFGLLSYQYSRPTFYQKEKFKTHI